jgi:hypothetical protein
MLNHSVFYRRYAKQSSDPIFFLDFHPPHWTWLVRVGFQLSVDSGQVLLKTRLEILHGLPIYAGNAIVGLHAAPRILILRRLLHAQKSPSFLPPVPRVHGLKSYPAIGLPHFSQGYPLCKPTSVRSRYVPRHPLGFLQTPLLPVAPLPAGYLSAGWAVGFLSTHRLGRHAGHTKRKGTLLVPFLPRAKDQLAVFCCLDCLVNQSFLVL